MAASPSEARGYSAITRAGDILLRAERLIKTRNETPGGPAVSSATASHNGGVSIIRPKTQRRHGGQQPSVSDGRLWTADLDHGLLTDRDVRDTGDQVEWWTHKLADIVRARGSLLRAMLPKGLMGTGHPVIYPAKHASDTACSTRVRRQLRSGAILLGAIELSAAACAALLAIHYAQTANSWIRNWPTFFPRDHENLAAPVIASASRFF